ncbi:hypothetical protein ACFU99_31425 [Streptomyces sp. NPDC057654]|uniref:hypothetical protein n=1 Tax=Streptomyces sp. NPDC057654 TaxID=3346196 RepID=UPI0036BDA9AC
MTKRYGMWAAAICTAATVGLAGCGTDSSDNAKGKGGLDGLSAQEISKKARNELSSASALRMKMDAASGSASAKMDIAADDKNNCAGTTTPASGQGSVEVVKRGDEVWLKPDAAVWSAMTGDPKKGALATKAAKGRYLHGKTSETVLKQMASSCEDLKTFQKKIAEDNAGDEKLKKGKETTEDGKRVVPLTAKGKDGAESTIYVAAEGKPYLLKIASKQNGKTSSMQFTDYGKPVAVNPPSEKESMSVDEFKKAVQKG